MEAGVARVDGASTSAPAGWYANPEGPGVRYWSGTQWGEIRPEHTSSSPASSSVAKVVEGQPEIWWVAVIAAAGMIIGGFGPWATALGFVSVNGTHGDGWFVIAGGAIGLIALWKNAQGRKGAGALLLAALAGAGAAVVAIADLADIESRAAVDPAWGIYAAMFGGITLAVAGFVMYRRSRKAAR